MAFLLRLKQRGNPGQSPAECILYADLWGIIYVPFIIVKKFLAYFCPGKSKEKKETLEIHSAAK